jgi:uncharacterized membrane protein YpjA
MQHANNNTIKKQEISRMKKLIKLFGFGFLTWLIPFIATFFMYTPGGQPLFDLHFIKTLLVLIGVFTAILLLAVYFSGITNHFLREGFIVGIVWLIIYWVLDYFILVPMANISVPTYFTEIGLRALITPMISIALGYLLEKNTRKISKTGALLE